MLIKLTAIAHPDFFGGKSQACYVDPTRVLCITRVYQMRARESAQQLKREVYDDLWAGTIRLQKLLNEKMPTEIDNQQAAAWAKQMHLLCHEVGEAYQAWNRAYREADFYPPTECTEVQLACGTALEHGVMLTRVWVTESPEEVVEKLNISDRRAAMSGLSRISDS